MRRYACKARALAEGPPTADFARGATSRRAALGVVALGALLLLPFGGCGAPIITFQTEAQLPATLPPEPTSTGSIAKRPASFGADLGAEDWRRAHAALAVALDPQGNGRPVKWDNPETTLRGSVNPTGLPYVADDLICRDFLASVIAPGKSRFVRGTGCKPSGGEWELKRIRTANSGG